MNVVFHKNLNRMALFAAVMIGCAIWFHTDLLGAAMSNIWLNGVIIGVTVFGAGACFADMFRLLPEYRWLKSYFAGRRGELPPRLLRPIAIILSGDRTRTVSPATTASLLDMILLRFEDGREATRYITNTLIFLGLLGTFWGLITTVGGFAELVGGLNFEDENIMNALQSGLARPLAGMSVAFTCSLFGLAGSLIVGFLGLQVQQAQNGIFRELEENLSRRTEL